MIRDEIVDRLLMAAALVLALLALSLSGCDVGSISGAAVTVAWWVPWLVFTTIWWVGLCWASRR